MTITPLQSTTFGIDFSLAGAPIKPSGLSFDEVIQRLDDGVGTPRLNGGTLSIAEFRSAMTGDVKQDAQLLSERLAVVQTPAELDNVVDAFLEGGQPSASDELSQLIAARRVSIHPLQEELDRVAAAHAELKAAAVSFRDELVRTSASVKVSELEAEVEALKEKIAEDLELKFKREALYGILD